MENTQQIREHKLTKGRIKKLLRTDLFLDVREIKACRCEKPCWSSERGNQRIDVELRDVLVEGNLDSPAIFNLRICNVSTENREMIALAVRYFFHIEIDTKTLSIEEAAALVNDANMAPSYIKTVLLNITDTGYGFCSEARFNITSTDDILECYNAVRFPVQHAASSAIMKISYYLQNKCQFDWEKKSVERGEIEKYDNRFHLPQKQAVAQHQLYPSKKITDVILKRGKLIACISWIPLLIVAFQLSLMCSIDVIRLLHPDFYMPHWCPVGSDASSFSDSMGYTILFEAILAAILGEIILIRHGYGTKRFWKHLSIWYAVYVVLTVGIIILAGMNFNVLSDPPIIPLTIAICLYPVIALLELMLVMAITRSIKKMIK